MNMNIVYVFVWWDEAGSWVWVCRVGNSSFPNESLLLMWTFSKWRFLYTLSSKIWLPEKKNVHLILYSCDFL